MSKKIYRGVIYCRLSKEDGNNVESTSIGGQRAYCEEYVSKLDDVELVMEPIVDDGFTGVNFERKGFKRLEEEIGNGNIDCVIVRDLSRFARNYIDAGRYLEKIFPELGVRFIAIIDNYDSLDASSQTDSFILPFKNLINDTYAKDISVKIRSSLDVKKKNGEFVGSFCPYGYKKDLENRNQLVVDEDVRDNIQLIFTMFKDGFSIMKIADRLNQMGVLSPLEYKHSIGIKHEIVFKTKDVALWGYNTVKRVLKNEVYIGVLVQGKTARPNYKIRVAKPKAEEDWIKIENAHESIVSYDDFMAVKEMMTRDVRTSSREDKNVLSGFLFCGDCGRSMVRQVVPSRNKKYVYYVCSSYKKHKICSSHSIPLIEVVERVFRAIHDQIELTANLEEIFQSVGDSSYQSGKKFNYEKQICKIEEEIERYNKMKLRLYEDFTEEVITKKEYLEFRNSYTNIIDEKEVVIKRLNNEMKQTINTNITSRSWVEIFKEYENIDELNRRVLMALVDRILIHQQHGIEIVFKYAEEYSAIMEEFIEIQNSLKSEELVEVIHG